MLPLRNFSYRVGRVGSLELPLQSAPVGVSQWKAEENVGTTDSTTSQDHREKDAWSNPVFLGSCAIASWKTPGDSCLPAVKTVTAIAFFAVLFLIFFELVV